MKKISVFLSVFIMSIFALSCGSSDDIIDNNQNIEVPEDEVVDDYNLLSVTSEGDIYKIGNNTGAVNQIGQIPAQHNLIMLSTVCKVDAKIYAFEAIAYPSQTFLIYDELTNSTTTMQLTFPNSIASVMNGPMFSNLKYNGSELVALVIDEYSNNPSKVVSIDLQSYEVTDLGISFPQRDIISTELINNDLFLTTRQNGFIKLDLNTGSVTELTDNGNRITGARLTKISDSKLALMKLISGYVNGIKPFEYDLSNDTFSDKSLGINYFVGSVNGKSFFHNGEVLELVSIENEIGQYILKANYQTNEIKTVKILNEYEANIVIIGIVE